VAATASDLASTVERLHAEVTGGTLDAETRRRSAEQLRALRTHFLSNRSEFSPDLLAMLKQVSTALGTSSESPARVLEELGFRDFRPGQREIIGAVLSGRDCIGVMPTGAGKSLTYQIPTRILGQTTLVVSPLIALMKDQVDQLDELGMRATFLNSSISPEEKRRRIERLHAGEIELLYAAPEGLEASVGRVLGTLPLGLIAIDEAHCISHWGHDFRPAYRNLAGLKRRFGGVPMLALTATATPEVTRDIAEQLGMQRPALYRGSFFRKNLRIYSYLKGDTLGSSVRESIARLCHERRGESGIVYCLSRKTTESTAQYLGRHGLSAAAYHAGLEPDERTRVQEAFRRDNIEIVCATIAFGMGIDKSNVRFVIHRDMPRSVEGYYQEIGRAGRDGAPADCVLFYSWSEVKAYDKFADESPDEAIAARQRTQARAMFRLAEATGCRHRQIVGYFQQDIPACGDACDHCTGDDPVRAARARPLPRGGSPKGRADSSPVSADDLVGGRRPSGGLADAGLFERLKFLRRRLADERGVPAYVIFSDATLLEMAAHCPQTESELLGISGVGPTKLERYGDLFLGVLRERRPA
jgi:ATP-dependent DNA helicase RecQ